MYTAPDNPESIFRRTVATVDLAAFRDNLRTIRSRIPTSSRLVAVLKADGYGHGALHLARVCESENVPMLAVALLEEAIALRQEGITIPILVFGPVDARGVAAASQHSLALGTPSPESIEAIASWSRQKDRRVPIHLHLDSGMNRMGLVPSELPRVIALLQEHPHLSVDGIFSHYANASDPADPFNDEQEKRFVHMVGVLREAGIRTASHHFANSAAAVSGRVREGDWVRVGLSLYGGEPLDYGESRLLPVMRWTTRIERLKEVAPNEIVGYGKTWRASERALIATLPVGYADGYDRLLSNKGEVLVRGRRAPIAGRVSMDLTTIDITGIPGAAVGDEVVLLGSQGDESIRAEELATITGTIPYEVFTSVSKRVPRLYVDGAPA
ncbi:MAG: alanine racemase [Acidobacteria bacterium]|nr:alanine racemase [Acidobacteriota bacterium]